MKYAILNLSCCLAVSLISSCASTSQADYPQPNPTKNFSVEGRFMAFDDLEGEAEIGSVDLGEGDIDATGFGAEVAFLRAMPDIILGWDEREYDDDIDSTEFYAGARFRFGSDTLQPYLEAKVRYGLGLEFTDSIESEDFWGWSAGGGLLLWPTAALFIDLNLAWEDTFDDIEIEGVDLGIDGLVGTVGVGFAF